ncbi:hypothetical protein CA850_08945 [Micromonospora echinospora]|uniref:Integral membrane protein n=1 Tax=Micromonospora echinospora TaxID=1877 RepID=A0A1C4XG13_MICEC|nr:hypothetical protein [Micromonospora echinospora]OZV82400.1 hypothetical protein CA850_08945 [Micromonospora echinospora]SCF07470.1 hypothetical protein GA0070618_3027 [Micromonospora echinospora]
MRDRWRPIGVLAGGLFAVNVVARLVTRFAFDEDPVAADRVSLAMFLLIGVILAAVTFTWARRSAVAQWGGDLATAVVAAMLATILIGPLLVGNNPFAGGAGTFFAQLGLYLLATGAGILIGYLIVVALGIDHRSQQLKRYAEGKAAKPRRPVRR